MKMKIFDKALEVLLKKTHINRPSTKEENIHSSYLVHFEEAYSDVTYFYVRTKDNKEALYLCPGYKFLAGENFLTKKQLENLPKKEYKNRKELIRNEITEAFFFNLYNKSIRKRNEDLSYNRYNRAFSYLTSLYYRENESYKKDYEYLFKVLKKECDNLGINYETDPETIIKNKLKIAYDKEEYKLLDFTICHSIESIDNYYKKHILDEEKDKDLTYEVRNLQYLKSDFTMAYPGEFLTQSENLISALEDNNYPNRETILKNYLEFFISKDLAFSIQNHLSELAENASDLEMHQNKERLNSNAVFIEDLEKLIEHNPEEEIYRYHATGSIYDAKNILEEGFYTYSKDLDSTSFREFDIEQILTYSYGNGTQNGGDYIIVISEPKDDDIDIVSKISEEELKNVSIVPRRNAIIGNKPSYKVDKKYIVGFIDKEHEKVIFNPEYHNSNEKHL